MKVLITQPKHKQALVKAFQDAGAEIRYASTGSFPLTSDIDLIVPVVDEELEFMALAREWFADKGIRVVVNDVNTVRLTRDKAEFNLFCRRHAFLHPRTLQGHDLIVKPRYGKGARGIQELDGTSIVQQKLYGKEVSIDYFSDFDANPLSIIPRFRKSVINGQSTDFEIVKGMDLTEVTRLGRELNLKGHNVIQGFLTENRSFYFTEVNCRYGGGSYLTFPYFNSPAWLVQNGKICNSGRGDSLRSSVSGAVGGEIPRQ